MKKITAQHHYTINMDELLSFFFNEAKVAEKHHQLGAQKYRLKSATVIAKNHKIDSRREVPVGDEVPLALRKFVKAYNGVRQRENWTTQNDGGYTCELRVDLDGMPVKVEGKMTLIPTSEGCTNNIEINVSGSLPIIGNLAAEFVAKSIEQQIQNEYNYILKATTKAVV